MADYVDASIMWSYDRRRARTACLDRKVRIQTSA